MSFLSDVKAYWASNTTLNAALPANQVFTGLAPETLSFPYAVLVPIGSGPNFTTGKPYWESFSFQISVFHTSLASLEGLAQTVMDAFDYQPVASTTISCERTNYLVVADPTTPKRVYQAVIEYVLNANRTLP